MPTFRILLLFFIIGILSCSRSPEPEKKFTFFEKKEVLVRAPGKKEMILRTERPLNLETPQKYFLLDYTPNDVFFVRWHLSEMPDVVGRDTFRLRITGHVNKTLSLSLDELETKFKPVTVPALAVCAGNARQQFQPAVPGVQWKNGAMGNAKWTGIPLRDLLNAAGLKPGALDVAFNGLDSPPLSATPDFQKSIPVGQAMNGEVLVAYEMNGDSIPLLNGYPLKLVVPGWYATYWIGMLHEIRVYNDTFRGFWMDKAYKVPKGISNGDEKTDSLAQVTEPIKRIAIRSLFVSPEEGTSIIKGNTIEIQGLAFDGGTGIARVEVSTDSGRTWTAANLDAEIGIYSWRRWRFNWTPESEGNFTLMVKATGKKGETQPWQQWNRSGYMKNEIERLGLIVQEN